MTNNGGIFYISPDFMINLREFGKHIKIGIQTKGYEEMSSGNNLLMCVGFIGKVASRSNTRFRLKVEDVVEVMGNKGIKLTKPIKINPEEYAGLEWNLEQFNKNKILTPESHLMYTNTKGETSIRFTDYNYSNQTNLEEGKEFINIEIIQERYEVDETLQESERRHNNNNDITFKCKGCKIGSMGIVEVEKHFKTCKFRTDNLGYIEEYKNQEKIEDLEKILENLYDSEYEIERNSIISQKELMESTSSSVSPFQRTAQPHTIDTSTENVPRRRVFRVNPDTVTENIRPMEALLQENAKLMEQVKLFKGKESIQTIHTSTQTSKPCFPTQDKIDEQVVHSPTNAKRSTVSDNKDTASPFQTVAGKDTSNPFMAVTLPKSEDEEKFFQQGQDKHVTITPSPDPNGDRLVPDAEHINTDKTNTSSVRDTSGNNITRSLSFGEEDYGEHAYYQDAQDPNEDDDSGMSFDSIALHNLDT
ncbi:hypothetical protein H5410_042702 [Solanum commersonii]|uniref:Uncharacterized protein n=1 Tax=Solanum commersonii TaxID=4109 RepID=A0A9J5XYE4_SOLCO|nr:hypothetical protein H5410_042702 [Solanum commersonii]